MPRHLKVQADITDGVFHHPKKPHPIKVFHVRVHAEWLCDNCDELHHADMLECAIFNDKEIAEFWADTKIEELHIQIANSFHVKEAAGGNVPIRIH